MRAIPIIIIFLVTCALSYIYRDSIQAWFIGPTPAAQTVVLRQVPTATATAFTPTPVSITTIATTPTPTPVAQSGNLPTTGPSGNILLVLILALAASALWQRVTQRAKPSKVLLDIL